MTDSNSGTTTVLLICRQGASLEAYHKELAISGVKLVCVQSIFGFFQYTVYCRINGILVDMPTYMRCSEDEKALLNELVAVFPALRIKCNEQTGEIRTLPFVTNYPSNIAPALFVSAYCQPFTQRKVRASERSHRHLSGLLSITSPTESCCAVPTVTTYISCSGCFLVNFNPWNIGQRGWLALLDLEDPSPIEIEVCCVRMWGESGGLPGMGVRFIEFSGSHKFELSRMGGQNFMLEDA
ncbi:MAG: PilZ domain-containing protein [Desulfuromonadaceae bacterium]|nr:PilZ domain-containing protein [Desulfuromonadaceae bacterium]MDD2856489.1 PilZ domain-containing protein [Desulfuromonadaceae bacterium]